MKSRLDFSSLGLDATVYFFAPFIADARRHDSLCNLQSCSRMTFVMLRRLSQLHLSELVTVSVWLLFLYQILMRLIGRNRTIDSFLFVILFLLIVFAPCTICVSSFGPVFTVFFIIET